MDWSIVSSTGTSAAVWLRASWPWLLVGAVAAAALFVGWWLWWRLPKRQVERLRLTIRDAKARADVEDNFRKTIGQLLGGAAVLIGAGLAYLQFQQQQRAAQDLLISNQVAKGFELLGNKEKDVTLRLGGIYALEGVMNTSDRYQKSVLEALCAFVREQTKLVEPETEEPPTADVQAALSVIGRREVLLDMSNLLLAALFVAAVPVDLHNARIPNALLFRAKLSAAVLVGANLSRTYLTFADLNHADLNRANLSGANLYGANLNLAVLNGADLILANLSDAKLSSAILHGADLRAADLTGADLNGADLTGADLREAKYLTQAQLDQACGTDVKLDPGLTIKPCEP